jgi:hypothetical protein
MSDEDLKAELNRLRNENAALKKGLAGGLRMKVSEKIHCCELWAVEDQRLTGVDQFGTDFVCWPSLPVQQLEFASS